MSERFRALMDAAALLDTVAHRERLLARTAVRAGLQHQAGRVSMAEQCASAVRALAVPGSPPPRRPPAAVEARNAALYDAAQACHALALELSRANDGPGAAAAARCGRAILALMRGT